MRRNQLGRSWIQELNLNTHHRLEKRFQGANWGGGVGGGGLKATEGGSDNPNMLRVND